MKPVDLVLVVRIPTLTPCGEVAFVKVVEGTRVTAVRLVMDGGGFLDNMVQVDAFIPKDYRHVYFGPVESWVRGQRCVLRCYAHVEDNKKSLRPFFASGAHKWTFEVIGP